MIICSLANYFYVDIALKINLNVTYVTMTGDCLQIYSFNHSLFIPPLYQNPIPLPKKYQYFHIKILYQ